MITIKDSELSPYFNSGQKKILQGLANAILDAVILNIVNNPSQLQLELDDLIDVNVPSPVNDDRLTFSVDEWVADAIPPGGGGVFPTVINNDVSSINAELDWVETLQYFLNDDSNVLITIPPQSSVAWPDDAEFDIVQGGTGGIVVEGGSGVFVDFDGINSQLNGVWSRAKVRKLENNSWVINGETRKQNGALFIAQGSETVTVDSSVNNSFIQMSGTAPEIAFDLGSGDLPEGAYFEATQNSANQLTFSADGNATFVKKPSTGLACDFQNGILKFRHLGLNQWHVSGDLTAGE